MQMHTWLAEEGERVRDEDVQTGDMKDKEAVGRSDGGNEQTLSGMESHRCRFQISHLSHVVSYWTPMGYDGFTLDTKPSIQTEFSLLFLET